MKKNILLHSSFLQTGSTTLECFRAPKRVSAGEKVEYEEVMSYKANNATRGVASVTYLRMWVTLSPMKIQIHPKIDEKTKG